MSYRNRIVVKNRNKRLARWSARKVFKIIGASVLIAFFACLVAILVSYINHNTKTTNERGLLNKTGFYNSVKLEDNRNINLSICGDEDSDRTIVTISGLGVHDFSIFAEQMMFNIKENAKMVLIDRAGYGFSDDTTKNQTIEQIVEDYRNALERENVEGPYVLLAHEFGSVYATYWAANYPDEIEAIVYVDGTEISEETDLTKYKNMKPSVIDSISCKLGLQRLFYDGPYSYLSKTLSTTYSTCSQSLILHSLNSFAFSSEIKNLESNFQKALDCEVSKTIPKMYVSTSNAFSNKEEVLHYFEHKNEIAKAASKNAPFDFYSEEDESLYVDEFLRECNDKYNENTVPFAKSLGNCILVKMPGDKYVYEQSQYGIAMAIKDYMLYLDGDKTAVKNYYEASDRINWSEYDNEELIDPDDMYDYFDESEE